MCCIQLWRLLRLFYSETVPLAFFVFQGVGFLKSMSQLFCRLYLDLVGNDTSTASTQVKQPWSEYYKMTLPLSQGITFRGAQCHLSFFGDANFNHLVKLLSSFSREGFPWCTLSAVYGETLRTLRPCNYSAPYQTSLFDLASTGDSCLYQS